MSELPCLSSSVANLSALTLTPLLRQPQRKSAELAARQRLTIRKRNFAMCVIPLGTRSRLFDCAAVVIFKYLAPDVSLPGLFRPTQPLSEDRVSGVKGKIVGATNDARRGEVGKLLVDAGCDGLFLITTPKLPQLPPRVLTALRHSSKCLM